MIKKIEKEEDEDAKDLPDNEEYISTDDLDIEVMTTDEDDQPAVYVKFTGFPNHEEAEEYAEFLAETLPLLLFETTKIH